MQEQDSNTNQSLLNDWVDAETTRIDIVASWESLYETYEAMKFTDVITDAERLSEFKWIVHNMNSFLSKIRTKLMSCQDEETMVEILSKRILPLGQIELNDRKALAYQKLRQQWIMQMINKLKVMLSERQEELEESNGWNG